MAQAMSSTNPTAPITTRNIVRAAPPTNRSVKVSTRTPGRSLSCPGAPPQAARRCRSSRSRLRVERRRPPAGRIRRGSARRALLRLGRNRRHPDLGVVGESHAGGHDADDRRRLPVYAHRHAEHVGIGAVPILPERVTDDNHRFGALAIVAGREITAEQGRLPEQANALAVILVPRACSGNARASLMFIEPLLNAARPANVRLPSRQS